MIPALAAVVLLASAPAPGPSEARLEIDASGMHPEQVESTERWAREKGEEALEQAGISVTDSADAPVLRIVMREQDLDFVYESSVVDDGEVKTQREQLCKVCNRTKLIAGVSAELSRLAGWLAAQPGEQPQSPPKNGAGGSNDHGPDEGAAPKRVAPIGGVGIAGAVIGAAGLGLTIAGGVQFGRTKESGGPAFMEEENFRQQGQILIGVGVGALVTGVAMLAVDVGLRRKKNRRAAAAAVTAPFLTADTVGLAVRGRF